MPRLPSLRPNRVGHSPHEEQTAGAMLVDQKQKGSVNSETNLSGQWHEPNRGHSRSLGALFIYCDGTLVLELFEIGKENCQIL